jgi:hypothetical protein
VRTLLGVALILAASAASADATVRYIDLVNTSKDSIVSFAVAPSGSGDFRAVSFADKPLHGGGDSTTVAIRDDDRGCLRDLRSEFADGRVLIQRGFDVCKYRSYRTGRYPRGRDKAVMLAQP